LSIGETYGIRFGALNNPYITNPRTQQSSPKAPAAPVPQTPTKDVFGLQTKPIPETYSQKVLSNIQNRLFTRLLPESFVAKYVNKDFLEKAAANNPRIAQMLAEQNIELKIEPENVRNITKSHLVPAMFYAREIMSNSGHYFSPDDYEAMTQAALLHDIGKALIPSEILNKKGALSEKEREVVKLHNDLGYEILKSTVLSPKVLAMVRNHHNYGQQGPRDAMTQILTVADVYSALKEDRPYKKAMSDKEAFEILEKGAEKGEYDIAFVNALKKSRNYAPARNTEIAVA